MFSPVTNTNNRKSSWKTLDFCVKKVQKSEKENGDNLDQYLNIDNFPEDGLQVKVVLNTNSGSALIRIPRNEETKCLVR